MKLDQNTGSPLRGSVNVYLDGLKVEIDIQRDMSGARKT